VANVAVKMGNRKGKIGKKDTENGRCWIKGCWILEEDD